MLMFLINYFFNQKRDSVSEMDQEDQWPDLSVVYNQLNKKELGFRPKKLTISKGIEDKPCDICAFGFDHKYQTPAEIGLRIISCFGCGLSCHLYCYGISTQIDINDHPNNQGYFVCDSCKHSPKTPQVCLVCDQKPGLKKKLIDSANEFVHPVCGLTSRAVQVVSFVALTFKRTARELPPDEQCFLCKASHASFKCSDCNKYAHVHCVLQDVVRIGGYLRAYHEDERRKQTWECAFQYRKLFGQGTLRGTYNPKQVKAQARATMKQFMAVQGVNVEIDFEGIFNEFSQRERIEEERDNLIEIRCPDHRVDDIFCSCQLTEPRTSGEMIQCDSCGEWYHYQCVMSKDEYDEKANKDKDYFCKYCQDWDNKRLNKILQYSPAVTTKDLLPEYLLINLPVSICLGIYCERSLQSLLEKYNEQQFQVTESLLACLPFQDALSEQVGKLKEKSHTAEFMNFLLRKSKYRADHIWEVQSQLNEQGNPHQAHITQNNKLKGKIKKVLDLFKDFEEQEYFTALEEKLNRLQTAFEIIQKKTKIKKSELQVFANNSKEMLQSSQKSYPEFQWFHNQQDSYKKWKKIFLTAFKTSRSALKQIRKKLNDEDDILSIIKETLQTQELIDTEEQFIRLMTSFRLWLNQNKVQKDFVLELLKEGDSLAFQIHWITDINAIVRRGQSIVDEFRDLQLKLKYDEKDNLDSYLESVERLPIGYGDTVKAAYEFKTKLQIYDTMMQRLNIDDENSDCEVQMGHADKKITAQQLEELLKLHEKVSGPKEDLAQIQSIFAQFHSVQEKFKKMLETKGLNETMRRQFQAEIQSNNQFSFPQVEELQKRLDVFKEVEKVKSSKTQTVELLEQSLQKAREFQFEEKLIQYFENELAKTRNLRMRIAEVLSNQEFNQPEIEQVKELLSEINSGKVQYDEKVQLQSIQKAIQFVDYLYEFYKRNKSADQEMEIESDKYPSLEFKLNQIQNPSQILFKQHDQFLGELETIMNKQVQVRDRRILTVCNQYADFLVEKQWEHCLELWKSDSEISLTLIDQVLKKQFTDEQEDFKELYETNLTLANQLINQINSIIISQSQRQVLEWQEQYKLIRLQIRGGVWDLLKIYNMWVSVTLKFFELNGAEQCSYESLKLLQEIIQLSHIPKHSVVYSMTNFKIQNFSALVERLKEYSLRKQTFLERAKSKKDLARPKIQGYSLEDALQLDEELRRCKVAHDYFSKEFYADFHSLKQLKLEFEQNESIPTQLYQKLAQCFICDQQTIDSLKIKIYTQKLQDILAGVKTVELQKAKKQFTTLVLLLKQYNKQDDLIIEQFQQILVKAEGIQGLLNRIRNNQQYTYREIEENYFLAEQNHQIHIENSQTIEFIYNDCQSCLKEIQDIEQSKLKVKEQLIAALTEKVSKLPLPEELKTLKKWMDDFRAMLQQYRNLRQAHSKQKVNPNVKELSELMRQFESSYNSVMIINDEVDNFFRQYQEFRTQLDWIESNLNSDQAFQKFNDLLNIFRWGEQYDRVKFAIWVQQVGQFKDNPNAKWGMAALQNFLRQGYEIIDYHLAQGKQPPQNQRFKELFVYLEGLLQRVLDRLISNTGNTGLEANNYVDGKIDPYELAVEFSHKNQSERIQRIKELQPKKPYEDLNLYQQKKRDLLKKGNEAPPSIEQKRKKVHLDEREDRPVQESLREQKRRDLIQTMSANQKIFENKTSGYLHEKVKEIENQEFGDNNNRKSVYIERMDKWIKLFQELQKLPQLSKKLIQKGFTSELMKKYLKLFEEGRLRQFEQSDGKKDYNPLAVKTMKPTAVTSIPSKTKPSGSIRQPTANASKDVLTAILNDDHIPSKSSLQQQSFLSANNNNNKYYTTLTTSSQILQSSSALPQQPISSQSLISQSQQPQAQPQPTAQSITSQKSLSSQYPFQSKKRSPSPATSYSRRQHSNSSSHSLPELEHEKVDKSQPLLYNPDAVEDQQQQSSKQAPKQQVVKPQPPPLQFGSQIFKLGHKRYKIHCDRSLNLDFFTKVEDSRLKKVPVMVHEIKLAKGNFNNVIGSWQKLLESTDPQQICGQAMPEKYSEFSEVNRLAEKLKHDQSCLFAVFENSSTVLILTHVDLITSIPYFQNYQPFELVTEQHFNKKENGIWRYWGNMLPKLCFVYYLRTLASTLTSQFSPIHYEEVRNVIKNKEVKQWVESKIAEHRRQKQVQPKLELEPVTSEDENNDHQQQVDASVIEGALRDNLILQELFKKQ